MTDIARLEELVGWVEAATLSHLNWKGRLVFLAIGLGIVGVAYLVGWVR